MSLAQVYSAANVGLDCQIVTVEVDIASKGLSAFQIVGLPDAAVNESRERVRTAVINAGFSFPAKRIIVNLAPADLPKSGPLYDLPIAIALLIAAGEIDSFPDSTLIIGELALDGQTRSVHGTLPIAVQAKKYGFTKIVVPINNQEEAAFVDGMQVYGISNLLDAVRFAQKVEEFQPHQTNVEQLFSIRPNYADFSVIRGQLLAKRALEIAAAGSHNVLLHGPPGSGKTLLAQSLPSIMPKMTKEEILEVSQIYSISGLLNHQQPLILERPFRSPHHTSSGISLIGGGTHPKPGEITLSHRGVLFLDELPEFPRHVLEALRQPLEDRVVNVSRVAGSCLFPAHFILIAAYNPCPCGNLYDPKSTCKCTPTQILRYQKKLSGPLLDRIDLHVEVPRVNTEELIANNTSIDTNDRVISIKSEQIRQNVENARKVQRDRFKGLAIQVNSEMKTDLIDRFCVLDEKCQDLIKLAVDRFNLSARGYHRILKLSRTIADLENSENIQESHITEALQYRPKDKN